MKAMILAAGRGSGCARSPICCPSRCWRRGQAAHRAPHREAGCCRGDPACDQPRLARTQAGGGPRRWQCARGIHPLVGRRERARDCRRHRAGAAPAGQRTLSGDQRRYLARPGLSRSGEPAAWEDLAHLWLVPNPPQHPQGDFSLQAGRVLDTPALTFSGVGLYHPAAFAGLPCGARKLAPCCATGWRRDGWVAACWQASGATSAPSIGCASWTRNCSPAPINITRS